MRFHVCRVARHPDERPHCERQLQAENDLAPYQQLSDSAVAHHQNADECRHERERAGD